MTAPDSLPPHALAEDNLAAGESRSAARDGQNDRRRSHVRRGRRPLQHRIRAGQRRARQHRNGYRPREWDTRAGTVGVSTRRVEKLAETLGVTLLSKSQVSAMAKHLDDQVAAFRNRPLHAGPYSFVRVDALTQKVREGGRIINVHALFAVGVHADGHREILGLYVATAEDGTGRLAFCAP